MTEKAKKILDEINLGIVKTLYEKITFEDLLSKDENGITIIEHLIQKNISLPIDWIHEFNDKVEVAYAFYKKNGLFYDFKITEDDMFKNINGESFIEFAIKKWDFSIIGGIKNHPEIIDLLISNHMESYLIFSVNEKIIESLMEKDSNGVYLIEKYINNEIVFRELLSRINNPKDIIEICKKHDKYEYLKSANENVLMYEVKENYTLLQDLYSKNIVPTILNSLPQNKYFINYLLKNNFYEYLKDASEKVLLLEIESGKTLLEELIEKNVFFKFETSIHDEKTIQILLKKNKLNLIDKVNNVDLLLRPIHEILKDDCRKNETLLEYLLNKGCNPLLHCFFIDEAKIIKILSKHGYYEFLGQKVDKDGLIVEVEPGVLLIDKLLEKKVKIKFDFLNFRKNEIAKSLLQNSRIDLLVKGEIDVLLEMADEKNTYLDYILKNIKEKKLKYNLKNISLCKKTLNTVAQFYLIIAKHDMMQYLNELSAEELLHKEYRYGKTLLDELLELNTELTINKIISPKVMSNVKIAVILKSKGIVTKDIDVPLEKKNLDQEYLEDVKDSFGIGPLPEEGEILLNKLNELFLADKQSDPLLISSLVAGYRQALIVNYNLNIIELQNLISVKEKNMNKFFYLRDEKNSYFRMQTGSVYCDNIVISTILHETGHALHYYLANNKIPGNYNQITENARLNPEILKKTEELTNQYEEIGQRIMSLVKKKYTNFFETYFNDEKSKEIEEFLEKSKEEKMGEFMELGISIYKLELILNNFFSVQEYIEHQKRIYIRENSWAIFKNEFASIVAIADILDAIYEGDLYSGTLTNQDGEKIKETAGHGIPYYCDTSHGFDEMVANFAVIVKSKDAQKNLNLLKNIVGDEVYNMLAEFYYNNIIQTKENEIETSKVL